MKTFKMLLAQGQESRTDEFFVDAAGVATIKLNGHFHVSSLWTSNAGNTVRTNLKDARITNIVLTDATNIAITNTTDLTAQVGAMIVEYCKTTD